VRFLKPWACGKAGTAPSRAARISPQHRDEWPATSERRWPVVALSNCTGPAKRLPGSAKLAVKGRNRRDFRMATPTNATLPVTKIAALQCVRSALVKSEKRAGFGRFFQPKPTTVYWMVGTCCAASFPYRAATLSEDGCQSSQKGNPLREKNRFALLEGRDAARPYDSQTNVRLPLVGACCCATLV
jgi:hypothetical protein